MITVHVGLHKTGSSSIQVALKLMRDSTHRLINTPDPTDDRTEQGWADRIRALGHSSGAIFSDENLLGTPYDGYQLAPKRVAILRSALGGVPYQLVVYLRPQHDWFPSVYLQGVQEGRTIGAEEFWAGIKNQPLLMWSRLLELLRQESGAERVIVRAHTRSRDAVADFFEACGLGKPPRIGKTMIRINASIAGVQAPLLMALNELPDLTPDQRGRLRHVFQQVLARDAPGGFSPFPESIQEAISSRYLEDWALVGESLREQDAAEAEVFHSEFVRWSAGTIPYAGDSLSDPLIERESVRSILQLSLKMEIGNPGRIARIRAKLREDPKGVPIAGRRAARRRLARRFGRDRNFDNNPSN